jgi:hypothetical protein
MLTLAVIFPSSLAVTLFTSLGTRQVDRMSTGQTAVVKAFAQALPALWCLSYPALHSLE